LRIMRVLRCAFSCARRCSGVRIVGCGCAMVVGVGEGVEGGYGGVRMQTWCLCAFRYVPRACDNMLETVTIDVIELW
jgi:hypothetical protein